MTLTATTPADPGTAYPAALEIRGLHVAYGSHLPDVVHGIDLTLNPG